MDYLIRNNYKIYINTQQYYSNTSKKWSKKDYYIYLFIIYRKLWNCNISKKKHCYSYER